MERLWNANYTKVWSANFMIFFSFMVVTPLLPLYLSEEFGADKDTIGIVLSGYTLTALLARPLSGYLVDSFPRKVVLMTAYFLFFAFFAGYLVAASLTAFAIVRTIHGAPMGAVTVANSTAAFDVLPPSRRAEGIGYYGLSNNLATAISPTVGLLVYEWTSDFNLVFIVALLAGAIGLAINGSVDYSNIHVKPNKEPFSLSRLFLFKAWPLSLVMVSVGCSYGVLATYIAIYGRQELGITAGTGLFFAILSCGLMLSRIIGARSLRKGRVVENASAGIFLSLFGYLLFASVHNEIGYYGAGLIIGLGNGHLWPAFQNMFVAMAPADRRGTANSTLLIAWDTGMGLGVLGGGLFSEYLGYHSAFWWMWLVNLAGVLMYFLFARRHYLTSSES